VNLRQSYARAADRVRPVAAGGLVALVISLAPPGMVSEPVGKPLESRWLEALDLRPYPPGTRPPEFSGRTDEGQPVSLAALRGRVVLLNFWATWCLECRSEMPALERLHREFGPEGLTILGINAREATKTIRRYADDLRLTVSLVLDPKGDIGAQYGVVGLPTTFLIGRDGRAVALAIGPREWGNPPSRAIILALLAEPHGGDGAR
jgi:peroxiredoxin